MAKGEKLAAPMMGRCTCFHPDQARRQRGKELQNLSAPKLSADHHFAVGIDSVDMKYILRQIDTDGHNFLLHESTPRRGSTTTSLHSYAGAGVVHPISQCEREACLSALQGVGAAVAAEATEAAGKGEAERKLLRGVVFE
jgi:hypothetical protein